MRDKLLRTYTEYYELQGWHPLDAERRAEQKLRDDAYALRMQRKAIIGQWIDCGAVAAVILLTHFIANII